MRIMQNLVGAILVGTVTFISISSWATDNEFSGVWHGEGQVLNPSLEKAAPLLMYLTLDVSPTKLKIDDCWSNLELQMNQCYSSEYSVGENGEILDSSNKKIGDIFPGQIVIFIGTDQVSEQMIFSLDGQKRLRFQYVFSTFDGTSSTRVGIFKQGF